MTFSTIKFIQGPPNAIYFNCFKSVIPGYLPNFHSTLIFTLNDDRPLVVGLHNVATYS